MKDVSKYDVYLEEVVKLHADGLRNAEIARKLGLNDRRISDLVRKNGLVPNKRKFNETPSELQHEVFISCVIGDGCIFKSKENKNYRMNLAHSEKQKYYFFEKYEIVKDFVGVEWKLVSQYDKRTKKVYNAYKIQSKVNPYFTRLYKKWYRDGKKIIIPDLFKEMTPRVLAYKFFDDGNRVGSGYSIAMDDYDPESVAIFRNVLLEKNGIKTNLHNGGKKVYIPSAYRESFKEIVLPYATKDVLYKLGEFRESPNM